tara:strand:- start:817 stop:1116 length:300 start_codon:yes stop_codon:yes gene_type:complete
MTINNEFPLNFESAKNYQLNLERKLNEIGNKLSKYPKGIMGLTPDHIKQTEEWKSNKKDFETAFFKLRTFNSYFTKQYKKERAAERKALIIKMTLSTTY